MIKTKRQKWGRKGKSRSRPWQTNRRRHLKKVKGERKCLNVSQSSRSCTKEHGKLKIHHCEMRPSCPVPIWRRTLSNPWGMKSEPSTLSCFLSRQKLRFDIFTPYQSLYLVCVWLQPRPRSKRPGVVSMASLCFRFPVEKITTITLSQASKDTIDRNERERDILVKNCCHAYQFVIIPSICRVIVLAT